MLNSLYLQPRNYQVSKEVVHQLEFAAIAVRRPNTDWQFEMFKRGKDNG